RCGEVAEQDALDHCIAIRTKALADIAVTGHQVVRDRALRVARLYLLRRSGRSGESEADRERGNADDGAVETITGHETPCSVPPPAGSLTLNSGKPAMIGPRQIRARDTFGGTPLVHAADRLTG